MCGCVCVGGGGEGGVGGCVGLCVGNVCRGQCVCMWGGDVCARVEVSGCVYVGGWVWRVLEYVFSRHYQFQLPCIK